MQFKQSSLAQEVMNYMRYTPAEQGRIANALFQMEAARRSGYNAGGKEQYSDVLAVLVLEATTSPLMLLMLYPCTS